MESCPDREILQRFAEGTASRAECRTVVRHLLARCGDCAARICETLAIEQVVSRVPDEVFAIHEVGRLVLGLLSPPCPQGEPSHSNRNQPREKADARRNVL